MVEIRDIKIGVGKTVISVPISGVTEAEVAFQARQAAASPAELIEWRAETFGGISDDTLVLRMLKIIRMSIESKLFQFTFRTSDEGGSVRVRDEEYIHIVKLAIDSRLIDLVDVECCVSEYRATELISYAKQKAVYVIGFNDAEQKLLSVGEMDFRIRYMQRLGVDIAKLVLRPQNEKDVLKILNAAHDLYEDLDIPISIIGAGSAGKYTRILCEMYGNSVTCGTLDEENNPDEIDVYRLAELIETLHLMK